MDNVETLYWWREIMESGGAAFAARGAAGDKGVRYWSVSGRVGEPGVYLAPNGVSVRQLIDEHAGGMVEGHALYGFLPGGASGGILPASLADEPLDFNVLAVHGSFVGSAAVVVLSQQDRATDAARNLMHFFAHESCGKCTPCRVGTAKSEQPDVGEAVEPAAAGGVVPVHGGRFDLRAGPGGAESDEERGPVFRE